MRPSKLRPAIALLSFFVASQAALAECDPRDFLVQDISKIQMSGETELAFVLTATEEEFNKAKKDGATSGSYGVISGSANYAEAKERARRIAETTKFDYRSEYAHSYFSQTVSSAAMAGYIACIDRERQTPGFTIYLASREGDFLTFKSFWVGKDTSTPSATIEGEPTVFGGTLVKLPQSWDKGVDREIVVKRDGNEDVFVSVAVGGQDDSIVVVKEPPAVRWQTEPVYSPVMSVASSWSNPCTAGQQKQCIVATRPGGSFVAGSASITNRATSDPGNYSESFEYVNPVQICGTIRQSTGACEHRQAATGTLMAMETFPIAAE